MTHPNADEIAELKACPFCGGDAEMILEDGKTASGHSIASVFCIKCEASTEASWGKTNQEVEHMAAKVWNTRHPCKTSYNAGFRLANETQRTDADSVVVKIGDLEKLFISHTNCDDPWYSCPKSEDGCSNDMWPKDECNCGADAHNKILEAALEKK